ncbi:MAG: HupE/UreJ family protein [Cocleimonas sp.]|nr:HupE/UreJ family protein [Cocleimonas sp.]
MRDSIVSWFTHTWFMQGIMHPLQTPAHLILILGLAFLLGQQKQFKSLLLLPIVVLAGFVLNHYSLINWNTELILLALALICGLLLVLRLNLPAFITIVLLIVCGVTLGLDSSPIMIPGLGSNSIISWRLGAAVTINIGIAVLALLAYLLNHYWNGIILRVAGSWIATSAIFVLTLLLAGKS